MRAAGLVTERSLRRKQTAEPIEDQSAEADIYRVTDFPLHYMASIQRRNFESMRRALRPHGVTPQEWRILATLAERDGQGVSELAEIAVVERTRTSRIVDGMEQRGLVRKEAHGADRRITIIVLTEAGRAKLREILPIVRKVHGYLWHGLSRTEFDALMKALRKIKDNAFRTEAIRRLYHD
jgi:DNA-binding MarR family transcriptional regulator